MAKKEPKEHKVRVTRLRSESQLLKTYGKYVVLFLFFAGIVAVAIVYFALSRTVISVKTTPREISTEFDVTLQDVPGDQELTIRGHYRATEKEATLTYADFQQTSEVPDYAGGTVTIVNETGRSQSLVETTRLLSENNVLFRTQKTITVPPNSEVAVDVKADQSGAAGNIGASRFTIVALHPSSQSVIYGRSDAAMTGGTRTATVLTREDLNAAKDKLLESLTSDAINDVRQQFVDQYAEEVFLTTAVQREILNETSSAELGQEISEVRVTSKIRLQGVSADPTSLAVLTDEQLSLKLHADQQLVPGTVNAVYSIKSVDSEHGTVILHVRASSSADLKSSSTIFDPAKFVNMDQTSIESYFATFKEIESINVDFSPFWSFQTSSLPDHIEIRLNR